MSFPEPDQWMVEAFREAFDDFKSRLPYADQLDLDTPQSIRDVYAETARIQAVQAQSKTLRASKRLDPYLKFLRQYESAVEVFVQVKPDLLALIWGPLKLILQFASNLTKAFDKIVEVLGDTGQILPDLQTWASVFPENLRVKRVLCLFYQDILDLHLALLNFFGRKKWDRFFEAFWPRTTDLVTQIQGRMGRHKILLTQEVTLESIIQARSARQRENVEIERQRKEEQQRFFHGLLTDLRINLYDSDLEAFRRPFSATSGAWILNNEDYRMWTDATNHKRSSLWLQGIPGAGKTVLSAKITESLRASGETVIFAFLTYRNPEQSRPLKVFQDLIFQLSSEQLLLQEIVREAYIRSYRELSGNVEFVKNLFLELVRDQGTIYMVIDGLDEVIEDTRTFLATSLLETARACKSLRILISCRNDPLLDKELDKCHWKFRVDHHNESDISSYLKSEELSLAEQWRELGADEAIIAEAKASRSFIQAHSKGMILYAKLMMQMLKSLDNPDEIREELQSLPEGLDQAYARILERIKKSPDRTRVAAERILQWMGCASESRNLRVDEILQALLVEPGSEGFKTSRKALRNLKHTCGPILDVENGYARFVHFSAKEYVFKEHGGFLNTLQSNQKIASALLTYLSFDSFGNIFSETWDEEKVKEKIKSKDFILFEYAATTWLTHLRGGSTVASQNLPEELLEALSKFADRRQNHSYQPQNDVLVHPRYSSLDEFPSLQSLVAQVESYVRRRHASVTEKDNDLTFADNDPTLVSRAHMRFRHCLESLLCHGATHTSGCDCQELAQSYGDQLFKCNRMICPFYNQGFATLLERDRHMRSHSRPYKCTELSCLFADLGLETSRDLQLHRESHHTAIKYESASTLTNSSVTNLPIRDLELVIRDAIEWDDLVLLQNALRSPALHQSHANDLDIFQFALRTPVLEQPDAEELFLHAARCGSEQALQLVIDTLPSSSFDNSTALSLAIFGENVQTLPLCFNRCRDSDSEIVSEHHFRSAIRGGNAQVLEVFLQVEFTPEVATGDSSKRPSYHKDLGLSKIQGPQVEEYLAVVQRHATPAALCQYIFVHAVDLDLMQLASTCLQYGADVNENCNVGRRGSFWYKKPLLIAVSRGLAEMTVFLLQKGVDIHVLNRGQKNSAGMKRIEAKLGMPWTEIVELYYQGSEDGRGSILDP